MRSRPSFGRAAGRFALDDEEFAARGIAFLAIGQLAGQAAGIHRGLAARELARLARGFAGARGVNALADDAARDGGVLVEIFAELFVDELLDLALDVAIELALGLAFELRLRQLHGDHGDQAFAHVVAGDGDFVLLLLEHAGGAGEIVDRARQRGAEAGEVRAAVDGVDGVGERENIFGVAVVVLQRDFDFHVVALAFHVNRRIVQRGLAAVQMLDEFDDAAGEAKFCGFVAALVLQRDLQALVQEGQLAQALRQNVVAVRRSCRRCGIGMKRDFRSGLARLAGTLSFALGHAPFVGLLPDFAVAPDFEFEPVGERVDDGDADAVQTAGNFVGVAVEFSAGVQHGHDDFGGGLLFGGVHVHGNAAAVVDHGDAVVVVHGDVDFVAIAGHGFVHRVVDDFPDEMMQTHFAGRADVHRGAHAHGFESAENFDRCRVVLMATFTGDCFFIAHLLS